MTGGHACGEYIQALRGVSKPTTGLASKNRREMVGGTLFHEFATAMTTVRLGGSTTQDLESGFLEQDQKAYNSNRAFLFFVICDLSFAQARAHKLPSHHHHHHHGPCLNI